MLKGRKEGRKRKEDFDFVGQNVVKTNSEHSHATGETSSTPVKLLSCTLSVLKVVQ
jgi:hypothetical protein